MLRRSIAAVAAVAVTALVAPSSASAQACTPTTACATTNMTASATVLAAVTNAATTNLSINAPIGGTVTIAPSSASAGVFTITGSANTQYTMQFTALPTTITAGAGAITLDYTNALALGATTASLGAAQNAAQGTNFTYTPTGTSFVVALGTAATVAAGATAGTYTATITLRAAYTGY